MRFRYWLDLKTYQLQKMRLTDLTLRNPTADDQGALAELMIDAYQGTIDYDGETIEDAAQEVERFWGGVSGVPLLDVSWSAWDGETLVSACLVSFWEGGPLISYVMTRAEWKGRGLGSALLHQSLHSLVDHGYTEARAVITEGNTPSETIFLRAGFERME